MPFITLQHQAKCKAKVKAEKIQEDLEQGTVEPEILVEAAEDDSSRDLVQISLDRDLELLKERADIKEKIELKRQLLPKYLPLVEQYREKGEHYQNWPLVYCTIWALDVEQIETALNLAKFAVEQQQKLPSFFKSADLQTFMAEGFHDWALEQFKQNGSASPYLDEVVQLVKTEAWPVINNIVLSKLYKVAGLFAERAGEIKTAVSWFEVAEESNPGKAGVKTRLQVLYKKLENNS
ncbi:phage terminase small subunit [Microbulbifer sp. SSSA007]|uniref:phage terminase small subunit n=1 Tax=Microbulbifer sp. SSSA007 TaxID=3243379 RepID=UPI0040394225